jgi:hypothetical protein
VHQDLPEQDFEDDFIPSKGNGVLLFWKMKGVISQLYDEGDWTQILFGLHQ